MQAHDRLRVAVREAEGRDRNPSGAVIDSQAVKSTGVGGPERGNLRGVTRCAREFGDKLAEAKPGRTFSDSAEIIRADRDSRIQPN